MKTERSTEFKNVKNWYNLKYTLTDNGFKDEFYLAFFKNKP